MQNYLVPPLNTHGLMPSEILALGFCRNAQARDCNGAPIAPESPHAIEWDLGGAIHRAVHDTTFTGVIGRELFLLFQQRHGRIITFNDYSPSAARCVRALYDLEKEIGLH